jgi:hypothetical protein
LGVIFLREPRRGAADGHIEELAKPTFAEIGQLFRNKDYLLYLGGFTIRMLAVSGFFFWGAVYLHREYGLPNKEATSFIGSAYFLTGVPGIFLAGILAGRLARKIKGAYAFWLMGGELLAGTAVLIVLLAVHDLAVAKAVLLSQMFFAGNSWGVIMPLLFEIAPFRLRSIAVSCSLAISSGGSTLLIAEVLGRASDQYGIARALLFIPAGYFIAALFWSVLAIRQYRRGIASAPILERELVLQSA